jgi:hypothetical protein
MVSAARDVLRRPAAWPRAGLALLLLAAATYTTADADLWGHLRFGLDTLETWTLPSQDPYSFTQDRPWVNHEWLSELQTGLAYRIGGIAGLALLKALLVFAALAVVWTTLGGARMLVRAAALALVVIGTIHVHSSIRPQVWTFLCLALLCRGLVRDRANGRWWLPLLFVFWANIHGGWIVGLGVLGVWAVLDAWTRPATLRRWVVTVAACALATFVTPYGWRLWQFMLETVRVERAILEWQPLWVSGAPNWLPWLVTAALAIWALRLPHPHKLSAYGVLAMLAYGALRVMRINALFIESAAILLAPALAARWPAAERPHSATRARGQTAAAVYLLVIFVGAAAWLFSRTLTCLPIVGAWRPEPDPVRLLASAQPGRLVSAFNWGQYAIWHLSPPLRISMDGRRETVYSEARLQEYEAIVTGAPEGLRALAAWRAEYVWLPADTETTRAWLEANRYRIEFESSTSYVAVRNDLPPLLPYETPEAAPMRCFPH